MPLVDKLLVYFTVVAFWLLMGIWWTFDGCEGGTIPIPMHGGFYCVQATKWVGK